MGKRCADEEAEDDGSGSSRNGDDQMGEFEDMWEDEVESDENIVEAADDEAEDGIADRLEDEEDGGDEKQEEVFLPTHLLSKDQVLETDPSAYHMLHSINVNWPYLSFDILNDKLGDNRMTYPATIYLVGGTQADVPRNNEITVMKLSQLHRTKHDQDEEHDSDASSDSGIDEDPLLEHRSIPILSETNRIRAATPSSSCQFCASMHADGKVQIWDIEGQLRVLDQPGMENLSTKPINTISLHKDEGFALDWSRGHELVTGDNTGKIYLTTARESRFTTEKLPFVGHKSSVEDLAWSPTEKTVFISASADSTVKVWDTRLQHRKPALSVTAHQDGVDINVLTWNSKVPHLLATGADDGEFRIWDMRTFKSAQPESISRFKWHTEHITSIQWCPTEESVLAVAGGDSQISLWDLSVEEDDEETKEINEKAGIDGVPSQLLFIHQGQTDIKEVKWHPQIPGSVVSTASGGFNVSKSKLVLDELHHEFA